MYPDHPSKFFQQTQSNIATHIARGSPVYSPFMQIRGPAHKINKFNGRLNESSSQCFDGKNDKTNVSKAR